MALRELNRWLDGGSNENGNYWYFVEGQHAPSCPLVDEPYLPDEYDGCSCDFETVSAFEDVQEGFSQWYAWNGDFDAHDRAQHTGCYPTRDGAVAALED